jgi:hypothetical protein
MLSEQNSAGIPAATRMPAEQNRPRTYTEEVPWLRYPPISRRYSPSTL